jgi:ribosomal protein S17E
MGKIKSKLIKRTGNNLVKEDIEFNEEFEKNKQKLKGVMPSKKIRNKIAGYLSRLKREQNLKEQRLKIK